MKYYSALLVFSSQVLAACDPSALTIIQTCEKNAMDSRINSCPPNDYTCQCAGYDYIAACFQSCPSDSEVQQMAAKYDGLKKNTCTSAQLVKDGEDSKKKATESKSSDSSSATDASSTGSSAPKETSSGAKKDSSTSANGSKASISNAFTNGVSALLLVAGVAVANL